MKTLQIAGALVAGLAITTASPCPAATLINGAGATFPAPIYTKWFSEYHKLHPDIQINYQPIGSGGGINQITAGTVDFGASDGPMTDAQIAKFKQERGTDILHFPTVLGSAVPSYNIPGVSATLNFTQEALAGIYLGKITKWNDPEIAKANPGVKLPANDIVVVHRSDGSGTTYCWTDYLSKVSPEWKSRVGNATSVNWPVGLGGKGNEGVAGQIRQTPYSIGYIELIYAIQNKIGYGTVRNSDGKFMRADLASTSAAAAGASRNMPDDFRVSITNAPGPNTYPIATFTWLLIPSHIQDPAKEKVIKDFLQWMMTRGQAYTRELAYGSLPKPVVAKEESALSKIR